MFGGMLVCAEASGSWDSREITASPPGPVQRGGAWTGVGWAGLWWEGPRTASRAALLHLAPPRRHPQGRTTHPLGKSPSPNTPLLSRPTAPPHHPRKPGALRAWLGVAGPPPELPTHYPSRAHTHKHTPTDTGESDTSPRVPGGNAVRVGKDSPQHLRWTRTPSSTEAERPCRRWGSRRVVWGGNTPTDRRQTEQCVDRGLRPAGQLAPSQALLQAQKCAAGAPSLALGLPTSLQSCAGPPATP